MASQISKNRRVSVRCWQGKIVVDIREFYSKDGKELPGKKGMRLSLLGLLSSNPAAEGLHLLFAAILLGRSIFALLWPGWR